MGFIKKIYQRKFTLISILMFFYIILNLIDGERGLISFYEKQKIKTELTERKKSLNIQLASIENKNNLLTNVIDLDYLEILFRQKFMVGKSHEKVFTTN